MTIQADGPAPGVRAIRLSGDFDLATSPEARQAFHEAIDEGWRTLLLDLVAVQYLDSSALSAITAAARHARESRCRLAIICPSPQIRRVFQITGLTRLFSLYDTQEEALR